MKLFTTSQIRQLDQLTIENEPITSLDLMNRAADVLYWKFLEIFPSFRPVFIFAGPGNNGGDAISLGIKLLMTSFHVKVFLVYEGKLSPDCEANRNYLAEKYPNALIEVQGKFNAPEISNETVIIDGLFGSGLSRPLSGIYIDVVKWINNTGCKIVSIDIPSGLNGEDNKIVESTVIVKAKYTFTLQFPKLAFFFSENSEYIGQWEILDIGILPEAIFQIPSDYYFLEESDIAALLKKRYAFSHKGTYGHGLIIAGRKGMAGASVLASNAALRTGAGLITVHGPEANRTIVQTAIPEVIFQPDDNFDNVSRIENTENFSTFAVGPGIGTKHETVEMLRNLLTHFHKPCVIDADALNIISQHKEFLQLIPKNSILTPHPKEFERLFGTAVSTYDRIVKAHQAAKIYGFYIILKGRHSLIATPEGKLYFNSTGNSGMASAGSGDVLTGIVLSLLIQGYTSEDAAKTAVYLHGLAGDLALEKESEESMIAGDIVKNLGKAFKLLKKAE